MANQQTSDDLDYLYKSLNGQINVDEAQGIVEAFVAGVGNKDSVGDICLPGCFTSSLKRRKPRVVWGHDWNSPIGKVLEIYEVGPNDPRLPAKMRKAGIGGLYARVQFNLKAEKGREAFANVSFFGMEQEWSIGYKTLDAVFDPVQTANLLKEVELYEVSPVLHGANQLTGTISIKADEAETQTKEGKGPCWPGYKQVGMKKGKRGRMVPNCVPINGKSLEDECCPEEKAGKPVLRDPKGGLTAAGRAHFKRTEGANLKPGVRGAADTPEKMRRKGSFLTRFFTNPSGPMKKPNGKPSRLALSAAAWGEPVPQNASDASALAAKGRRLLERYENSKKKKNKKKDDSDSVENKNYVAAIYSATSAQQNETFGRASELTRALAARFGGPVRLVTADNDIAVFEMGAGASVETMRVAYHYDGDEFMFGTAQQVKPETVYIPINQTTSGQTVGGVTTGITPNVGHHAGHVGHEGHCCPSCGNGGNCDASVALTRGESPRIAFMKLKSLGDQLNFEVVPVNGGFLLKGFGFLSVEAQNFVVNKIEQGMSRKFVNPAGMAMRRGLGVPNISGAVRGFNVDMNPFTARDADLDKLVLEGNPLVNMGRGVPDPTPFGIPDGPRFGDPNVPRVSDRMNQRRPLMMPAVPEPTEVPEPAKEPKPVTEPSPFVPKPNRPPTPVPQPEPETEPVVPVPVPEPEREPVPVRPQPIRPTVPVRPLVPTGRRRIPKRLAEDLARADSFDRPSRQTRQRRLRDEGIDEMRRLMLLDGPEAGMTYPSDRQSDNPKSKWRGERATMFLTYDPELRRPTDPDEVVLHDKVRKQMMDAITSGDPDAIYSMEDLTNATRNRFGAWDLDTPETIRIMREGEAAGDTPEEILERIRDAHDAARGDISDIDGPEAGMSDPDSRRFVGRTDVESREREFYELMLDERRADEALTTGDTSVLRPRILDDILEYLGDENEDDPDYVPSADEIASLAQELAEEAVEKFINEDNYVGGSSRNPVYRGRNNRDLWPRRDEIFRKFSGGDGEAGMSRGGGGPDELADRFRKAREEREQPGSRGLDDDTSAMFRQAEDSLRGSFRPKTNEVDRYEYSDRDNINAMRSQAEIMRTDYNDEEAAQLFEQAADILEDRLAMPKDDDIVDAEIVRTYGQLDELIESPWRPAENITLHLDPVDGSIREADAYEAVYLANSEEAELDMFNIDDYDSVGYDEAGNLVSRAPDGDEIIFTAEQLDSAGHRRKYGRRTYGELGELVESTFRPSENERIYRDPTNGRLYLADSGDRDTGDDAPLPDFNIDDYDYVGYDGEGNLVVRGPDGDDIIFTAEQLGATGMTRAEIEMLEAERIGLANLSARREKMRDAGMSPDYSVRSPSWRGQGEFWLDTSTGRIFYRDSTDFEDGDGFDGEFVDIAGVQSEDADWIRESLLANWDSIGFNTRGDFVYRGVDFGQAMDINDPAPPLDNRGQLIPNQEEVIFSAEQIASRPRMRDDDIVDGEIVDDDGEAGMAGPNRNRRRGRAVVIDSGEKLEELFRRRRSGEDISDMMEDIDLPNPGERAITDPPPGAEAGMAGRARTRAENADLGRKIWLARTHDKLSLDEAGRRFRTSRQRARQLELLHHKYLRDLGQQHANRLARAMVDDPMTGLTDSEADLLRRRFDGELLEEAAERLRTDRFAIRRMEQLALAKLRNRMIDDGPSGAMALGRGGRAVDAARPKAPGAERPGSRRRRNAVDPSFIEILNSLKELGEDGLSNAQRVRLAALMRFRRVISNKIDQLMVGGSRRRRLSAVAPEVDQLNKSMRGPFSSLAEAAKITTGSPRDFVSSAIKIANDEQDPLDIDGPINVQVFEALRSTNDDFAAVARTLGMDEEIVRLRAAAHTLRLLASARPARMKVFRRLQSSGDTLTSIERFIVGKWLNGASDLDIAERMGDGYDAARVAATKVAALAKLQVDVNSPEMRSRVVDGRIFYDEFGLFVELTDDAGATTYNRIGDGPMSMGLPGDFSDASGGMSPPNRRVVFADFGDGGREYVVTRTVRRDRANPSMESVMMMPVRGDDQATVSTLIGRQLLGDDRGANLEFPAILLKSDGRITGVADLSGKAVRFYGSRVINESAPSVAERVGAIRANDSAARTKMDQDVEGAERRLSGLMRALDHLISTGDWIGGDANVTGRVPEYATMMRYGLDSDDDGTPITPRNRTKEQFELDEAEFFLSRYPDAPADMVEQHVQKATSDRLAQVRRKVDIAKKELDRLKHVRDSKEVRRSQNVVDLETLDDETARMLADETGFLASMSGQDYDAAGVSRGADGFAYVVHKGPDRLSGGVLDPRMSAGVEGRAGSVAGQGDTRGANRIYVARFLQSAEAKSDMVRHSSDLAARIARGETVVTAHPSIRKALRAQSQLLSMAFGEGGLLNMENFDEARVAAIVADVNRFVDAQKRDLQRYQKIRDSLTKFGGRDMDQMLSAESDATRAVGSLDFYGRYADFDLPRDVVSFSPGFTDGLTRRWTPVDETMLDRWELTGSLRGGAFLAAGRLDAEIVRGGLLGPSGESQIIAPLKPLIGISTPVRITNDVAPSDPKFLVQSLGPALMARAIKMHKRDGFVDIETVLTDPDLAPQGYVARTGDAEAGMAALEPRRPILDERGRLDPILTRDQAYLDDREERDLPDGPMQRLLVPQTPSTFIEAPPGDLTPETRRAPWAIGYTGSAADIAIGLDEDYPERLVHVVAPSALPPDNAKFPVNESGPHLMLDREPLDFLVHVLNDINRLTVEEREASERSLSDRGYEVERSEFDPPDDFTPRERHPTYLVVDVRNEPQLLGPPGSGITRIIRIREILRFRLSNEADESQPGGGPFWRRIDPEAVARGEPGRTTTDGLGYMDFVIDVDPTYDGDLIDDTREVRIKPESIVGRIVSAEELSVTSQVTRQLYEGDGVRRMGYPRPYGRSGGDAEAGMALAPRTADLVARTEKYFPSDDRNDWLIPESVMPDREQAELLGLLRDALGGKAMTLGGEQRWRMLLLKAESLRRLRSLRGELPHERDEIGVSMYDTFAADTDRGYGQLIPFVEPGTTTHIRYDRSGNPVEYVPVRIGRSIADASTFEYHPASQVKYALILSGRQLRTWNHPEGTAPGVSQRVASWEDEGVELDVLSEEIRFQASRTRQMDELLGFTGDSPQKIILALRRAASDKSPRLRDRFVYDPYGYVVLSDAPRRQEDSVVALRRSENFADLQRLIAGIKKDEKSVKVTQVVGYKPGSKTRPSLVDRVIRSPRVVSGVMDEITGEFVLDGNGTPHIVGYLPDGSPIAVEISDLVYDRVSPRRADDEFSPSRNRAPGGDAEAGMSSPTRSNLYNYIKMRLRGEGGDRDSDYIEISKLPGTARARDGGAFDTSPAGIIRRIVAAVRKRDRDAGGKVGLVFSYPSSVKDKPGVKEDRNRTIFNPLVVYGEYDKTIGETRILVTDDRGITRLVPMSQVDLSKLATDEERLGDHSSNNDVQVGDLNAYVVGDEYVDGKKQRRVFSTDRMRPVIRDDDESTKPRPATSRPTADTTSEATDSPDTREIPIVASDSDDQNLVGQIETRPGEFDAVTLDPRPEYVAPGAGIDGAKPTAREVARGLARNDPKAIEAGRADEKRLWERIRLGTEKWIETWKKRAVIDEETGEEVIDPKTGKTALRTPFRKAWRPWGNPIGPDGRELPTGIKAEMDRIRSWPEFMNFIRRKKLVFVDWETTGIPIGEIDTGRPLQVGIIVVENGDFANPKRLEVWIDPAGTPLSDWTKKNVKKNGIPVGQALATSPGEFVPVDEARRLIAEVVGADGIIISHNMRNFDMSLWKEVMGEYPTAGWMDTLAIANWVFHIDSYRFKQIQAHLNGSPSAKSGKKNYDRDMNPFVNWISKVITIRGKHPEYPHARSWGGRGGKPDALDRIGRRATGPLKYIPMLKKEGLGQWYPKFVSSNALEALARYFDVPVLAAHDAVADINVTAKVFLEMVALAERWGRADQMFDPNLVQWAQDQVDNQYTADLGAWRNQSGITERPRERLFDPETPTQPSGGDAPREPRPGGGGGGASTPPGGGDTRPPGGGGTPPRDDGDPNRRLLYQTVSGVRVYETPTGIHYEFKSVSPKDGPGPATAALATFNEARDAGFAIEFNYGRNPDGSTAAYRIISIELTTKSGVRQSEALGPNDLVVHGIDLADGKLKKFDFAQINAGGNTPPRPSELTELPANIYGVRTSAGPGGKPTTPAQYADHMRRRNFGRRRSPDGPFAGMAGLTNRDGATDSSSYWVATSDDVAMADMSDVELSEQLAAHRLRFENAFHSGPSSNAAMSRALDSVAAANRVMRIRSNDSTDQNGFSVSMGRMGYKLTGEFRAPPGIMDGSYELPGEFVADRAELARNANLSLMLDYSVANGEIAEALERVSRLSRVPRSELLGRLSTHDYSTYSDAITSRAFRNTSEMVSDGVATPSSLGMIIDPASDPASAARAVESALRRLGINTLDIGNGLRRGGRNYAQSEADDLINQFNESVSDLFSFDHDGRRSDPEFRVKSDAIKDKIRDLSDEIRRRHLSSPQADAEAGMGTPDPDLRRVMSDFVRIAPSMDFEVARDAGFDEDWKRLSDQIIDDFARRPDVQTEAIKFAAFGDALKGRASVVGLAIDRVFDPSKARVSANSPLGRDLIKSAAKILALIYDVKLGSTDMLGLLGSAPGAGPGSGVSGLDVTYKMIDSGAAALFARGGRRALVAYLAEAVSLGLVPAYRAMGILDRLSPSPRTAATSSDAEAAMGRSVGSSPFGDADGIPILSGSKWFDARLHAMFGTNYEKIATGFGNRFRTLPDRIWNSPTDDDLVDIYHYATMLNHDSMIEDLVIRGDRVDAVDFSQFDVADAGQAPVGVTGVIERVASFTGLPAAQVLGFVERGRDVALVRRLAAMDPESRIEHANAMRRRRAFMRLTEQKRGELGDDFPLWMAEASIMRDREESRSGVFGNDFAELMDDETNRFYGETPASALKNISRFLGMDKPPTKMTQSEPRRDGEAGMAGKKPFIRQRYDFKPVDGGFVIIDTDNRNAISSRVFKDRREALRGAERMDRGDKTFDPFAPPPSEPKTAAEVVAEDPSMQEMSDPGRQPTLFNDDGDANAGMSSTGLPSTLRFVARNSGKQQVSTDNVRSAMSDYESGRASIPFPSPDDAPVSRLIGGYASSDSALHTVLGRIEQLAPTDDSAAKQEEMRGLVQNLSKLQRRRNYFYNQLMERLDPGDPDFETLESWHSQRAGIARESSSRFGVGSLPVYILPRGAETDDAQAGANSPSYMRPSGDVSSLEVVSNDAADRIGSLIGSSDYSVRERYDEAIRSVQRDVARISRMTGQSMVKFGQNSVRIGAQLLAMADRTDGSDRELLRRELISAGLSRMLSEGGARLGLAYLVNAVDVGLLTHSQAKEMLRRERRKANKPRMEMTKPDGLMARGQMSRLVSELMGDGLSSKSAETATRGKRLSMITETVGSVLAE